MPTEEPSFASKPLVEKKPAKKRRPSKTAESTFAENNKQTKLSRQLTQIYQDKEGHLPDMRKIKIKKNSSGFKTFFVVIFIGGLLAAAAWAGFLLMPNNKKFSEEQIKLTISGPQNITAGTTTTYKISYENNQSLALKQATLNVQYPEGFVFISSDPASKNSGHTEWQLNDIGAHKKNEITITGLTYGSLDQKKSWRVFLTYQPENFGSELQKAAFLDIAVTNPPYSLAVAGPTKTLLGNAVEYIFTVKKEYDSQTNKLELKPSWPQNFFITSSSPAISKDNKWIIDPNKSSSSSLAADSWTFKIIGKFSAAGSGTTPPGDGNEPIVSGNISGTLFTTNNNKAFALATAKATTELTQNDLDFNLAINGSLTNFSAQPGDNLNITLALKNQSANDLKNVTLKLTLDAPSAKKQSLLDWSKIEDKFDGDVRGIQISDNLRRGEISWSKIKIPDLAKIARNQEVSIDVKLPIKDNSSFNFSDLNGSSQITVLAEVSFKDTDGVTHTYSGNQIIITINSDLKFEARDSVSGGNLGIGEKHAINWVLTNNFHPLKNLTLSADIYGDVKVDLPSPVPAGEIKFDSSNKKITWTIAEMPESVDVLAVPITITLNKINPTQELLISKVHIQAEDTVTGEKLDFMGEEVGLNR